VLIVDAANVVGSRPDGWWRDRAAASERLIGRIAAALDAGLLDGPVTVVLEGRARQAATDGGAQGGQRHHLAVERAPASGDDRIVELVSEAAPGANQAGERVTVVTADRELIRRVQALGAQVEGPGTFLRLMEQHRPDRV
jgi:hypothetical protein